MLKMLQRFVKMIIEALCVESTSPHVVVNEDPTQAQERHSLRFQL